MIIDISNAPTQPSYSGTQLSAAEREAFLAEKKAAIRKAQLDAIARDSGAAVAAAVTADDAPDYAAAEKVVNTFYHDLDKAVGDAYEAIREAGFVEDVEDEYFEARLDDRRGYNGRDHEFWSSFSDAASCVNEARNELEYAGSRLTQAAGLRREDSQ